MIIGVLMLLVPTLLYLASLPFSGRLAPLLRWLYRLLGGGVVLIGSAASLYLAAYSGDQGGIAAFFLQIAVNLAYGSLSVVVITVHWLMRRKRDRTTPGR